MKHKIILLSSLFIFFIIIFSGKVFGVDNDVGYVIKNYNMDIVVNDNNTFDITETIDVKFTQYGKRGIIREIPRVNYLKRINEKNSKNIAYLSNVQVNEDFKFTKNGKFYKIKIGKNDSVVSNQRKYIIKYRYDIGKDPLKNIDEFYYYIIGEGWDTTIENVEFSIKMPKKFDEARMKFFKVYKNNFKKININYIIRENTIIAKYNGKLLPREGLSIRMILPEGYFYRQWIPFSKSAIIKMLISLILTILAIKIWMMDEKKKSIVCKEEYYPPNKMNNVVLRLLYDGTFDKNDIAMLIVGLLNKGYLKFEKIKYDSINWNYFKIIKIKDYDGNDKYEKIIFEELFKNKDVIDKEDYKHTFYDISQKIYNSIDIESFNKKIIDKNSMDIKSLIFFMSLFVMMAMFLQFTGDFLIKIIIMAIIQSFEKAKYPFRRLNTALVLEWHCLLYRWIWYLME